MPKSDFNNVHVFLLIAFLVGSVSAQAKRRARITGNPWTF